MAKFVPAWDKTTGKQLPNPVPKQWLDNGTFPNLAATAQAAGSAAKATADKTEKKGA